MLHGLVEDEKSALPFFAAPCAIRATIKEGRVLKGACHGLPRDFFNQSL